MLRAAGAAPAPVCVCVPSPSVPPGHAIVLRHRLLPPCKWEKGALEAKYRTLLGQERERIPGAKEDLNKYHGLKSILQDRN